MFSFEQLKVNVFDSANPTQVVPVSVVINVQRNVNGPQFEEGSYDARIAESYPIGASVTTVSAKDSDNDEVRYKLTGPPEALNFFYINPLSGDISVTNALTDSSEREYRVSGYSYYCKMITYW